MNQPGRAKDPPTRSTQAGQGSESSMSSLSSGSPCSSDQLLRSRVQQAVDALPDSEKAAYLKALKASPELVASISDPLAHLRAEHGNIQAAAKRLIDYWKNHSSKISKANKGDSSKKRPAKRRKTDDPKSSSSSYASGPSDMAESHAKSVSVASASQGGAMESLAAAADEARIQEERRQRKRAMDAMYARNRRRKEKEEEDELQEKCLILSKANLALRVEETRLTELLKEANDIVSKKASSSTRSAMFPPVAPAPAMLSPMPQLSPAASRPQSSGVDLTTLLLQHIQATKPLDIPPTASAVDGNNALMDILKAALAPTPAPQQTATDLLTTLLKESLEAAKRQAELQELLRLLLAQKLGPSASDDALINVNAMLEPLVMSLLERKLSQATVVPPSSSGTIEQLLAQLMQGPSATEVKPPPGSNHSLLLPELLDAMGSSNHSAVQPTTVVPRGTPAFAPVSASTSVASSVASTDQVAAILQALLSQRH